MKTNKMLAKEMSCTPRQVAKSRKRGWIFTVHGVKVKITAPPAVHLPKTK